MKKKISLFIFALLILPCMLILSACGNVEFKINFMVDNAIYYSINTSGNETLSLPDDPTKDGYIFDGWYWDNNVWQRPFTANSLLNEPLKNNMCVYAKWDTDNSPKGTQANFEGFTKEDETTYSISISNATETLNMSNIVQVSNTSSWKLTTDIQGTNIVPSKVATLNVGDNTYYILVTANNDDVCLYTLKIRRRPIYTVSFNGYSQNQYIEEDKCAVEPSKLEIKGYTFGGWNFDFSQTIKNNTSISPILTPNSYKITFYSNDDRDIKETKIVTFNTACQINVKFDINKDYYKLEKFSVNQDGSGAYYSLNSRFVYNSDKDLDLYAVWTPITYTITYHNNGGSEVNNPNDYNVLSEVVLLEPTRKDYTFDGWYTDKLFTNKITQIQKGSFGNLNLYAKFSPIKYNITYILNDGINNSANPTYFTAQDETIELLMPQKDGYEIGYWTNNDELCFCINTSIKQNIELKANYIKVNGENTEYYFINNREDMLNFSQNSSFWSKLVYLTADIDCDGLSIKTIGDDDNPFSGTFNGINHVLFNINKTEYDNYLGVFGKCVNATIENLGVVEYQFTSKSNNVSCGGLVGHLENSSVSNCFSNGVIYTDNQKSVTSLSDNKLNLYVSGLIGYNKNSSVINSYSDSNLKINSTMYWSKTFFYGKAATGKVNNYVGGLIGYLEDTSNSSVLISGCFATGVVESRTKYEKADYLGSCSCSMENYIGGFIGFNSNALISDCFKNITLNKYSPFTICGDGTDADLKDIYNYVFSHWDCYVWNLNLNKNPTLKNQKV